MTDDKDTELIAGIRDRNRRSMAEAMQRFGPMVATIAGMMVRDSRDAEELVQDTFIGAFRDIRSYRPAEASFATWLGRIAYHRSIDMLRRRRIPFDCIDETAYGVTEADEPPDDAAVEELHEALALLSPAERTLITLVYFEDLPLAKVAYIMESNPGALSARLYRLKQKLARIINERRKI